MKKHFLLKNFVFLAITGFIWFKGVLSAGQVRIEKLNYRGWEESYVLTNGQVELIVVPKIGRVMSCRFSDGENILWENPELFGKDLPEESPEKWFNFGGDKVWPGPQGEFKKVTGRNWPPDEFFDGRSCSVEIVKNGLKLITPVSRYYGARLTREFVMDEESSLIHIKHRMEKINIPVVDMTIWSVTQIKTPEAVYVPLNPKSKFPEGYQLFDNCAEKAENLDKAGLFLKVVRNPKYSFKVGLDTKDGYMAAVYKNVLFMQHFKFEHNKEYPDSGCSVEVYSNPDPLAYMEMEILSPLNRPIPGCSFSFDVLWSLHRLNNIYNISNIKIPE